MVGFRRCTRCVMDNRSDETIYFNERGECNYCRMAYDNISTRYFPNQLGEEKLKILIEEIKCAGKDKQYDCIMGLSGGLDSSYLAYLGYKWGLRVLAVHIDDGFDTEISKENLKKLVNATGFDYEIVTPDVEQFNDLTLAFMRAGVPNIAIPQDNVLFAFLYKKMKEYKIEYFLSGANFALESILQKGNNHSNTDVINIKDIYNKFGTKSIDKLCFISSGNKAINKIVYGMRTVCPLNYIDYNRDRAFSELYDFCKFEYYGRKHLENILTAFVQLYWLPQKFGLDKRTSHLSSMIVSGQMSRDDALEELKEPLYEEQQMEEYISFLKKKLGVSDEAFRDIMNASPHQHDEYKTECKTIFYKLLSFYGKLRKK